MSDDVRPVLDVLRADLAHVTLADPTSVRRRGDRRRRRLAAGAVLGAAVLVIAVIVASASLGRPSAGREPVGTRPPVTTTDAPPPTSAPPTSAPSEPGVAPEDAILPDLRGDEGYQTGLTYRTYLSPPRPCARTTSPSDADLLRSRPAHGVLPNGNRPTVVIEYVARYVPGGAARYLDELRADVERCPGRVASGDDRDDRKWSIVEAAFVGDESVLLRLRGQGRGYDVNACCNDWYVAVVREGDVLVTLANFGWEGGGGDRVFTKLTAGQALDVARAGV